MRGALGFILPVLLATGCVWSGPFTHVEDPGPPNGDPDRTHEYWNGLRGVMSQRTTSDDLRALANLVQRQSETIRTLPDGGVDPELVDAARAVATCQERVIELAEIADFQLTALRTSPALAKQFAQANQQASAAAARLAKLNVCLSARYGVEFAAFER
jgi:hypothetical protein